MQVLSRDSNRVLTAQALVPRPGVQDLDADRVVGRCGRPATH